METGLSSIVLPAVVVVMGVSGSGKTTVGERLAHRLGWAFADGDRFHSRANVAKMARGIALSDADRLPWLEAIARQIDGWRAEVRHGVVTCSALKRRYRDILIGARCDVRLLYLKGTLPLIAARLAARRGHFMPASLLESQFAALEEPGPDERPIAIVVDEPPDVLVEDAIRALGEPARA